MPYDIQTVKGGVKVKSPHGFKSKQPLTLRQARAQQKALYANTKGK